MAKVHTFTDDFSSGTLDSKWGYTGGVSVSGGKLSIPPTPAYNAAWSNSLYDLTSSNLTSELVSVGSVGNGTIDCILEARVSGQTNAMRMLTEGGWLYAQEEIAGVKSQVAVPYSAIDHRWWRLREASGTIFWQTSADGLSWAEIRQKAAGLTYTSVQITLWSGYYGTEPSPGQVEYDNVNLPPPNVGDLGWGTLGAGTLGDSYGVAATARRIVMVV